MINYKTTRTYTPVRYGLYISDVSNSSDFRVGDRLVGVNGIEVTTADQIQDIVSSCQPDDVAVITVMRNDELIDLNITLTEEDVNAGRN